jgi:NAD(P)-dependent dehydrogenase (short-subunit alcohol dehydrogenase family)
MIGPNHTRRTLPKFVSGPHHHHKLLDKEPHEFYEISDYPFRIENSDLLNTDFMTAAFLPLLQKSTEKHHGWSGTVINISSISGMVKSAQHHFAYNASKGAAIHLNRLLASEIAGQGLKIRVNSIAPGVFPSEMTAGESGPDQKSHIEKEKYAKVPAQRPGKDEDMAQAVLFFAANQYLNGQTLAVDGGYTLAAGL